jgi:hypothetical protein
MTALRASNPSGFSVPFAYVRDQLARRYGCAPFDIDQWPAREVALALEIARLEGGAAEHRQRLHR